MSPVHQVRATIDFSDEEYQKLKRVSDDAAQEASDSSDHLEAMSRAENEAAKEKADIHRHKPTQANKDKLIGAMVVAPSLQESGSSPNRQRTPITIAQYFASPTAKDQTTAPPSTRHV
jgi:hypothetical protein